MKDNLRVLRPRPAQTTGARKLIHTICAPYSMSRRTPTGARGRSSSLKIKRMSARLDGWLRSLESQPPSRSKTTGPRTCRTATGARHACKAAAPVSSDGSSGGAGASGAGPGEALSSAAAAAAGDAGPQHASPRARPRAAAAGRVPAWAGSRPGRGLGPGWIRDGRFLQTPAPVPNTHAGTIRKISDNKYEGNAKDILKKATGIIQGSAMRWSYKMEVPVKQNVFTLTFDDWMFLMNDGVLINRSYLKKFGFTVENVVSKSLELLKK